MSARRIEAAETRLAEALAPVVGDEEVRNELLAAFRELAESLAEEEDDRRADTGDWHRWE